MGEQHLGAAEEQIARIAALAVQREVKAREDARLRLGVEVHERVAADEEIEPRDRRVLHQVVAAEDHRAAQIRPEDEASRRALEIALDERGLHAFELLLAVARQARLGQRLLVGIGAVHFDALAHRLHAERLGEHHGERVGFLARCAARRPDADVRLRRLCGEQFRHHLLAQVIPRRRVAEKRSDVDEDGVEELGELLRVDLEMVDVGLVIVEAQELHAPRHAPQQARALVAGEVEAAALLQEFEQPLELAVLFLFTHVSASTASAAPERSRRARARSPRARWRARPPACRGTPRCAHPARSPCRPSS